MKNVTPMVRNHILRLFRPEEQSEVARLLQEDCSAELPGTRNASAEGIERIQCAALKLSDGCMEKLYDAIALAQTDWRDLLVSAGFANDTQAHKQWRN